jgi:ribose 5-phosphate isomerase B
MRVAFGTDESNGLTASIKEDLANLGHQVVVVADPLPWVDAGRAVARAVTAGQADAGVVCCWTGTGVTMAATKVPGARAALCADAETARGARRWNDANICAISLRLTSRPVAREVLEAFLETAVDPAEASQIAALD